MPKDRSFLKTHLTDPDILAIKSATVFIGKDQDVNRFWIEVIRKHLDNIQEKLWDKNNGKV